MSHEERIHLQVNLNYVFQKLDERDYKSAVLPSINKLPLQVMVVDKSKINVLDQGNLGSCVSNAFALYINMTTSSNVHISRLLHYYCGRGMEGDSSTEDTGLDIRQAAKIIGNYGACSETLWPYNIDKFATLPPLSIFQKSLYFKKYVYTFINQDIISIKNCLSVQKLPIIFGINVYSSFLTNKVAQTGIVPMPDIKTEINEGGHCIVMIGYDDSTSLFLCANSWGTSWGQKGLFYIPYAYILNKTLASDFCYLNFIY